MWNGILVKKQIENTGELSNKEMKWFYHSLNLLSLKIKIVMSTKKYEFQTYCIKKLKSSYLTHFPKFLKYDIVS